MLLEHPGQVVTREEMRQKLWPADTFVEFEHGLNSATAKCKGLLFPDRKQHGIIDCVYGSINADYGWCVRLAETSGQGKPLIESVG